MGARKEAKATRRRVSLNHLHVVGCGCDRKVRRHGLLISHASADVRRAGGPPGRAEEWLKAIIRTAKLDDKGNTLQALNELQEMDATEGVDLASLIDDDSGLDAFERFVASLEDKKTKDVFACWRLQRTQGRVGFDPWSCRYVCLVKQLEKRLAEDFLEDGGRLPSEIAVDARRSVLLLCTPMVKRLCRQRSAGRVCR